jgi:DNA-binding response OmpR family regulator
MLTSRGNNEDIVKWLDLWADDYLVKPFEYNELLARMNSIHRRKMKNHSNTVISIWNIELDIEKHEVRKDWKNIKLSKLEYDLFKFLLQNKWKALSREEIYKIVWWEFDWDFMFSKTIDVYVWYLRRKLWKDLIETKKAYWFLIN